MRSLQDEIRQAQRELSCPVCGRSFNLRDIRIRSYLGSDSVELSVVCSRGHAPIILLIPVSLKEIAKAGPITERELKTIHQKIDNVEESINELLKEKNDRQKN